ncbi:MAG: Cytidine and deoxycytidylate deaminase zinc-binding region [Parcubacteria group bacterium]|nr:Cytidine and deoxycytidylate deaminase zinc-binding region [Parcubacteria group bacterium]
MHSENSDHSKAIIAYVPALHAGYVNFFKKYPDAHVFVLGTSFIDAYPRLNRDLRALKPIEAVAALHALKLHDHVSVLEIDKVEDLAVFAEFILPNEDVSRDFAEKFLAGKQITLENIFLRWDGVFSNKENEVPSDRVITTDVLHQDFMLRAIQEGDKSADWWRQIGALIVKNGEVVAVAHVRYFPSDLALDIFGTPRITVDFGERPDLYISMHAEADLISQAAKEGISLAGASMYSSTFPCINCAFLIARSGISKVYYSQGYSRLDADGILKNAGIEIILVQNV